MVCTRIHLTNICSVAPTTRVFGHSKYRTVLMLHIWKLLACFSNINESGANKHEPRLHNETDVSRCFDLCHIYRHSVENGSVTSIYTRAPFSRRNKYPQVTNVSQCYSRRTRIYVSTNVSYKSGISNFSENEKSKRLENFVPSTKLHDVTSHNSLVFDYHCLQFRKRYARSVTDTEGR
jgi:hypothetical protein